MSAPLATADRRPATTLTRDSIRTRVRHIVLGQLMGGADVSVSETAALSELGIDSLDTVEIIMALEEDFAIEITDEAMERIVTLGDATDVVIKALALAGRPVAGEAA